MVTMEEQWRVERGGRVKIEGGGEGREGRGERKGKDLSHQDVTIQQLYIPCFHFCSIIVDAHVCFQPYIYRA